MTDAQAVSFSRPAGQFRNNIPFRILAVAGSAGLSGSLFYLHAAAQIAGHPAWMAAGLLYAVSIGLTAILTFRFLPKLGPFMELTSVSRLLLACAAATVPEVAVTLTTSPLLNATLIVAGAFLIRAVARASWPVPAPSAIRLSAKRPAQIPGRP